VQPQIAFGLKHQPPRFKQLRLLRICVSAITMRRSQHYQQHTRYNTRALVDLRHQRVHRRLALAICALLFRLARTPITLRLTLPRRLLQGPLGDDAFAAFGAQLDGD